MKSHKIKFIRGALLGLEFPVGDRLIYIGRGHDSDVRIPDKIGFQDVSRVHIMIFTRGDELLAVNMSSHRTLVNEQEVPCNGQITLTPGMHITMGMSTEFCVLEAGDEPFEIQSNGKTEGEERDEESASSVRTQATLFGDASAAAAGDNNTVAPTNVPTGALIGPKTGDMEEDGINGADAPFFPIPEEKPQPENPQNVQNQQKARKPGTDVIPTPIVSPEDIAALIAQHRQYEKFKFYKRVGIFGGCFLMLVIAYFAMRPHPETNLSWPRKGDGKFDDKQMEFASSLGKGAVGVLCPCDARMNVRVFSNGVTVVDTYIGRDRDVPLRLRFSCERSRVFLKKTREVLFDEKRRKLEDAGGWNFLAASPLGFLGPNNGVPYREVQYLRSERSETGSTQWFGHLIFAVHGDCVLTFTREIPAVEQWRGGTFLARETMLLVGDRVVNGHWEGRPDYRDEPLESMLAEANGLMSLRTPLHWKDVEFLLQSVMIKSGGSGPQFTEALKLLMKLREEQRMEFNRLKVLARSDRILHNGTAALEEARRIFSSPDDKRSVLLKKGRWE